jgi:hypothetical protein
MYVTYMPDEGDKQEFIFNPNDINNFDAESIESVTGWDWDEFYMHLQKGSTKARRALLWVLLRAQHRGLQFRDVQFKKKQLEVEYDKSEVQELIDNINASPERPDVDRQAILDQLDREMEKAREVPDMEGKAHVEIAAGLIALPSHKSAAILSPSDS